MNTTRRMALNLAICGLMAISSTACTPSQIHVKRAARDALAAAEARLIERGIALDPAGRRPDRLRTAFFCYREPGRLGRQWDRSFAVQTPGPVPFEHRGTMQEQEKAQARCPHLFRTEIFATPGLEPTQSAVRVESAWWKIEMESCEPVGDPLMGQIRCHYRYVGAQARDESDRFFYGVLSGL